MALVETEEQENGVVRLTLNRSDKRNALSIALRDAISDKLDALVCDEQVKLVLITAAAPGFCAGFDLAEFGKAAEDETFHQRLWASSDRFHERLMNFPLPTVAAVNGVAMGGGFDLTVLCDIRIASSDARFGHPEAAFGDVVYAPLHDLVGGAVARDLCLTGRIMGAEEAARLHLVSQVVAPDALDAAAATLCNQIVQAPRDLLMRSKAKFLNRAQIAFTETLAL